ncbi:hypothetical protein ONZ45_g4769 [Pleurotus djamor]|nr:hypothetical protein ONZ45_g4769 [Pleurotus djamor]
MNSLRMIEQEDESNDNEEVTWDDQQRINTFSKLNGRLRNIEERLEELKVCLISYDWGRKVDAVPKQEKESLDDLSTELELADEDEPVLYKIGEAFLHMPHPQALKRLESDQSELDERLAQLTSQAESCETEMKELKVTLYAKFGKSINLDE